MMLNNSKQVPANKVNPPSLENGIAYSVPYGVLTGTRWYDP